MTGCLEYTTVKNGVIQFGRNRAQSHQILIVGYAGNNFKLYDPYSKGIRTIFSSDLSNLRGVYKTTLVNGKTFAILS